MHPNPRHDVLFGVEMEFQDDIEPLTTILCDDGILPSPRKHEYHCGCEHCAFDTGYDLKAQRDGSCGGELITRPFAYSEWNVFKQLTDHIQLRSIQTKVRVGLEAGVHVHVTPPRLRDGKGAAFAAFYLWQQELLKLAQGRERHVREFNGLVGPQPADTNIDPPYGRPLFSLWMNQEAVTIESLAANLRTNSTLRRSLYDYHNEYADRHSTLNTRTGHGTWEYRLWNSSQAAWRIRAYVSWSVALADGNVATEMLNTEPELRKLGSIFLNHGHVVAGASVNRQARILPMLNERTRS